MERAENVFAFVEFSSLRVAARDGASFGPSSQRPLMVILSQDQHRGSTDRGMEKWQHLACHKEPTWSVVDSWQCLVVRAGQLKRIRRQESQHLKRCVCARVSCSYSVRERLTNSECWWLIWWKGGYSDWSGRGSFHISYNVSFIHSLIQRTYIAPLQDDLLRGDPSPTSELHVHHSFRMLVKVYVESC